MAARLEEEGIFVNPIGPPAVPPNLARLRITPTAAHTDEDLSFAVETMARVAAEIGVRGREPSPAHEEGVSL
jgi:7-keto-8-aminopelargonate synthetase-like enzyme